MRKESRNDDTRIMVVRHRAGSGHAHHERFGFHTRRAGDVAATRIGLALFKQPGTCLTLSTPF